MLIIFKPDYGYRIKGEKGDRGPKGPPGDSIRGIFKYF